MLPAMIFVFSVQLNLPMISVVPGSELTKEPFRWDQRIFSLVLRLPGSVPPDALSFPSIPQAESQIDVMCEVTGGEFVVNCHLFLIFFWCSECLILQVAILAKTILHFDLCCMHYHT